MSNPTWWEDVFTVISKWLGSSSIICVGLMMNYDVTLMLTTDGVPNVPPTSFFEKLFNSVLYTLFDLFLFGYSTIASLTHNRSMHEFSDPLLYRHHPNGEWLSTGTIVFLIGLFAYIFLYLRSDEVQQANNRRGW